MFQPTDNYTKGVHPGIVRADVKKILAWYDAGAGSGSHLAETLGIPGSREVRALANILQCAKESAEVQRMLAELAT